MAVGSTPIAAYRLRATEALPGWPGQSVAALERCAADYAPEIIELALAAQRALDLETSAVDLVVESGSEPSIIEVNPLVSVWETLGEFKLCDGDVADLHLRWLVEPWLVRPNPIPIGVPHG